MKKRIMTKVIAAAMTGAMALSLAACGGASSGSSASQGGAAGSASGAAIKIGGSGPLTGAAAIYGTAVKNAAEMAVEEINAKGGTQYELNFQDDAHDAEQATNAYGVLKDWGMQVSLATVTSAPMAAVAPMYKDDHIFGLTPSASSLAAIYEDPDNETNPYGDLFQVCFTDPNQGKASADYFKSHPELGTKIFVIYNNEDNYSTGVYKKFIDQAKANGLDVVGEATFMNSTVDFSVQVGAARDSGADLVFLPIYYTPASQIFIAADSMGYKPSWFGIDGMDGILTVEGFDTKLAEGVYLLTPFSADATDDLTKKFVENYKAKYGDIPNQFAADSYDAVYAIAKAVDAAGVTADMSASDICDKMVSQFTSMSFDGLTGKSVTWSASGEVSKTPAAVVIENGTYVGVEN